MCANWVNETRGTAGGVKDGKTWFFGKIILLGRTYNKIHLTFSCVHMSMVYNNALYASMQILEECNSLCLLPSFNKICWLSLTNALSLSIISLLQIFIFYTAFLQGWQGCFKEMHRWVPSTAIFSNTMHRASHWWGCQSWSEWLGLFSATKGGRCCFTLLQILFLLFSSVPQPLYPLGLHK